MKKIIDYIVIVASQLSGLEKRVLENIKLGWQPFGSIMYRPASVDYMSGGGGGGQCSYGQTYRNEFYSIQLVKYED